MMHHHVLSHKVFSLKVFGHAKVLRDARILGHAKSVALAVLLAVSFAGAASAQNKYDPGATDTEIKIGNIMPYSGPASAYATSGKTEDPYFRKINHEGG